MATETSRNPEFFKRGLRKISSDIEAVADTIIINGLDSETPHCFVGVQFFDDALGVTPATPGAGSAVVTVETVNNEGLFESVPSNTIDATAPVTVSYDANSLRVQLVPAGVTVANFWRAIWTGNKT